MQPLSMNLSLLPIKYLPLVLKLLVLLLELLALLLELLALLLELLAQFHVLLQQLAQNARLVVVHNSSQGCYCSSVHVENWQTAINS